MNPDRFSDLQQEAGELTAILMTLAKNAKRRDKSFILHPSTFIL